MKLLNHSRRYSPGNTDRIRTLRREMSASEQILWSLLRNRKLGFVFRRQHPIGPYALDFYCPEAMLCIEVDGEQHADRVLQDQARDRYLLSHKVATIRIPSLDLFVRDSPVIERWLERIVDVCEERSGRKAFPEPPPPTPSSSLLRRQEEGVPESPSLLRRQEEGVPESPSLLRQIRGGD